MYLRICTYVFKNQLNLFIYSAIVRYLNKVDVFGNVSRETRVINDNFTKIAYSN